MSHPKPDREKEWLEKLFGECEDEFYESFGVYDGKFQTYSLIYNCVLLCPLDESTAVFVLQLMIFFPLMTTRKTLETGLIVLGKSISIKSMLKPKDWQHHLQAGKGERVNKKRNKKSKARRSCMQGCRGNMPSILLELHVKKKRLGRARRGGTMRGVQLLLIATLQLAAQS